MHRPSSSSFGSPSGRGSARTTAAPTAEVLNRNFTATSAESTKKKKKKRRRRRQKEAYQQKKPPKKRSRKRSRKRRRKEAYQHACHAVLSRVMQTARHGTAVTALVDASEDRLVKFDVEVIVPRGPPPPPTTPPTATTTHHTTHCHHHPLPPPPNLTSKSLYIPDEGGNAVHPDDPDPRFVACSQPRLHRESGHAIGL